MDSYCLLVVDDVQIHRTSLQSGLDRIGPFTRIDVAGSVGQAQQLLADNAYDAVLCDRRVLQARGYELLKWMRARPHYRSVPFIIVSSGSGNEEICSVFGERGIDDQVAKLLHPDAGCRMVGAAIGMTGRRRARLS
ncbi:MAG: response regulator [Sideroxyarcus sp.]|nr:response regulator [Sideroxyarcus sp.]